MRGELVDPRFRWWAALCETCLIETTDDPKCRECDTDLEDAPKRGPFDEPLVPDIMDALWPTREDLEAA